MRVFYPLETIDLTAPSHGPNAQYMVSYGLEDWGGEKKYVYKVQMKYDGRVAGRKSPSFPEGSDDMERVFEAIQQLRRSEGGRARGQILNAGSKQGIPIGESKNPASLAVRYQHDESEVTFEDDQSADLKSGHKG